MIWLEIRDYFSLTSLHFIVYNDFFLGGVFIYFYFIGKEKGWAYVFDFLEVFFFFLINFL